MRLRHKGNKNCRRLASHGIEENSNSTEQFGQYLYFNAPHGCLVGRAPQREVMIVAGRGELMVIRVCRESPDFIKMALHPSHAMNEGFRHY